MRFIELDRWFDQLPAVDQARIAQERRALILPEPRLIPKNHGSNIDQHLDAAKGRFLASRDPFCLIRVSDCELGLLGGGYLPSDRLRDLAWHMRIAGFDRGAIRFRPDFIAAIREAELVGLQQNWLPVLEDTTVLFSLLGIPTPHPRGVEVHLPYKLLVDGSWFRWLSGKKVLLVGTLAPALEAAHRRKTFLDAYQMFGPLEKVRIVGAIRTRSREEGGAWADYDRVLEESKRYDYDVALLSCGVTAKPLAWKLRKRGKTAIDAGFVFDALLGDKEREVRPIFSKIRWPGQV